MTIALINVRIVHAGLKRAASVLLPCVGFLALSSCRPESSVPRAVETARHRELNDPAPPGAEQGSGAATTVTDTSISPRQIPNFHVVHPFLLRGAAPTPAGLSALKDLGVKTVIDLRISPRQVAAEKRVVAGLGMRFINLPMSGDPPTEREVKAFLAEATAPTHPMLFVHCQHGADRTGTMVGIYREQADGWSFEHAYREMRRYGFNPHWRHLTATVNRYASMKATP